MIRINTKIGERYNHWTVLSNEFRIGKVRYIKVRCDCGKERDMIIHTVTNEKSFTMCNSCSAKLNNSKRKNKGYKSFGDIGGTLYNQWTRNAKSRNLTFSISKEFLWDLFLKQSRKCALSGMDLCLSRQITKTKHPDYNTFNASLDRIDSSKGYIEGNVQWVHKWINTMKNTLSNEDFIYMCSKVSQFNHDNFEPNLDDRDMNFSRRVQRLTVEDTLSNNTDTSFRYPGVDKDIV